MALEIERRFLVRDPRAADVDCGLTDWCRIRQGYLGWVDGFRIRIRTTTDSSGKRFAVLTQGLAIPEVELVDPEQLIELPPWLGEEITLNPRYGNSTLARRRSDHCRVEPFNAPSERDAC